MSKVGTPLLFTNEGVLGALEVPSFEQNNVASSTGERSSMKRSTKQISQARTGRPLRRWKWRRDGRNAAAVKTRQLFGATDAGTFAGDWYQKVQ